MLPMADRARNARRRVLSLLLMKAAQTTAKTVSLKGIEPWVSIFH
jgi:hypothetical protein